MTWQIGPHPLDRAPRRPQERRQDGGQSCRLDRLPAARQTPPCAAGRGTSINSGMTGRRICRFPTRRLMRNTTRLPRRRAGRQGNCHAKGVNNSLVERRSTPMSTRMIKRMSSRMIRPLSPPRAAHHGTHGTPRLQQCPRHPLRRHVTDILALRTATHIAQPYKQRIVRPRLLRPLWSVTPRIPLGVRCSLQPPVAGPQRTSWAHWLRYRFCSRRATPMVCGYGLRVGCRMVERVVQHR